MLAVGIKEKVCEKGSTCSADKKGKVSRKVRQPLKLTTPPFL